MNAKYLVLHRFRYIHFSKFYLENKEQGRGVQHLRWRHSKSNNIMYKSYILHFCLTANSFRNINILELLS